MKFRNRMRSREWPLPKRFTMNSSKYANQGIALELPFEFETEYLNLAGVAPTLEACRTHFGPLELSWSVEFNGESGQARASSTLRHDPLTRDTWTLWLLERASLGKHVHNLGGEYGELIIGLSGRLSDTTDDGTPVILGARAVLFHAPGTDHAPRAPKFWAGLIHQPRGSTAAE